MKKFILEGPYAMARNPSWDLAELDVLHGPPYQLYDRFPDREHSIYISFLHGPTAGTDIITAAFVSLGLYIVSYCSLGPKMVNLASVSC
jgi:hypothetical protein